MNPVPPPISLDGGLEEKALPQTRTGTGAPYGYNKDGDPRKKTTGARTLRKIIDGRPYNPPPAHLPLPLETLRRDGNVQDAARLYIHYGITNLTELSRQTGVASNWLIRVRVDDRWDDWKEKQMLQVNGGDTKLKVIGRTLTEEKVLLRERDALRVQATRLEIERNGILDLIGEIKDKTGPVYTRLLKVLETLNKLIANGTGYGAWQTEISDGRRGLQKLRVMQAARSLQGQRTPGEDLTDDEIIEIVELEEMPPEKT